MKRILPFDTNVELKSYPYYSNYLSILKSNDITMNIELFCKTYELRYVFLKGQVKRKENDCLKKIFEIIDFELPIHDLIKYICTAIDNKKQNNRDDFGCCTEKSAGFLYCQTGQNRGFLTAYSNKILINLRDFV